MSEIVHLKAYLPFYRMPFQFTEGEDPPRYENSRRDLISGLQGFLSARNANIREIFVEQSEPPEHIAAWLKERSWLSSTFLTENTTVSAAVRVDVVALKKLNNTKHLDDEFICACAAYELSIALEDWLFLSELALPGRITAQPGAIAGPSGLLCQIEKKAAFSDLYFVDKDYLEWPDLLDLDLTKVYNWASQVGFGKEAFASERLGRALAALSHVVALGPNRQGETLFRSMQGLESFYCDGVGDLRRQMSEKIKMWIGPWNDRRNIIGQLYDIRSKFIHGAYRICRTSSRRLGRKRESRQ